jgi:hypothetical protein
LQGTQSIICVEVGTVFSNVIGANIVCISKRIALHMMLRLYAEYKRK